MEIADFNRSDCETNKDSQPCWNLCNDEWRKKKKTRKKNREILCGSPNCLHPREQGKKIFTMLKLGLHKMIFILTLRNEIPKIPLNFSVVTGFVNMSAAFLEV